jgi:hypothetical protein
MSVELEEMWVAANARAVARRAPAAAADVAAVPVWRAKREAPFIVRPPGVV